MIATQAAIIDKLMQEIAILKVRKNSGNSSLNPSGDIAKPARVNLREKSGRKPGGQPGHKPGNQPKMSATPDEEIEHRPTVCMSCGRSLLGIDGSVAARRQEFEVPMIDAFVREHQQMAVACTCGCNNLGVFPADVRSTVQFGKSFEALTAFLCTRHYIPVKRVQEIYMGMLGVSMSTGAIGRLLRRMAKRCAGAYAAIKGEVAKAIYVGADETGAKIDGEKGWFWVWQTEMSTYIVFADSRGFEVVTREFPNGFPEAFLGHDSLAAQFKTVAKAHQMCMAHVLRELKWNIEAYGCKWSQQMTEVIDLAWQLKKAMQKDAHGRHQTWVIEAEEHLDQVLTMEIPTKNKKSLTLQKRLIKKRDSILQFLYHPEVPPDNNASERAIRNVKIKQKVSTQFKSPQGARDFATIRSVIDTAIKRGENVFEHLKNVA